MQRTESSRIHFDRGDDALRADQRRQVSGLAPGSRGQVVTRSPADGARASATLIAVGSCR